jgi:hypothetical protein
MGEGQYSVTEYSALGQTDSGTAILNGNGVTMNVNNILTGESTIQFVFSGDVLQAQVTFLGMRMPLTLQRS